MLGGLGAVAFVKTWRGKKCVHLGVAQVGEVGMEGDWGAGTLSGEGGRQAPQ